MKQIEPIERRHVPGLRGLLWIDRIFQAQQIRKGGTVRRAIKDVKIRAGLPLLEHECRVRGFHLTIAGPNAVIQCNDGTAQTIC